MNLRACLEFRFFLLSIFFKFDFDNGESINSSQPTSVSQAKSS